MWSLLCGKIAWLKPSPRGRTARQPSPRAPIAKSAASRNYFPNLNLLGGEDGSGFFGTFTSSIFKSHQKKQPSLHLSSKTQNLTAGNPKPCTNHASSDIQSPDRKLRSNPFTPKSTQPGHWACGPGMKNFEAVEIWYTGHSCLRRLHLLILSHAAASCLHQHGSA